MSKPSLPIRCDHWLLAASPRVREDAATTIAQYRRLVNALCGVLLTHWPEVKGLPVQDLERYFHPTSQHPNTPYGAWFARNFSRFPSYLRRAATLAAHGHVSSFLTRYRTWQGSERRHRTDSPPAWGKFNGFPVLYAAKGGAGALVRRQGDGSRLTIKLCHIDEAGNTSWVWHPVDVVSRGQRYLLPGSELLSPTLHMKGGRLTLAQPVQFKAPRLRHHGDLICAIDLGVNTPATCVILSPDGSVRARKVLDFRAVHKARLATGISTIQGCAKRTLGGVPVVPACASPVQLASPASPVANSLPKSFKPSLTTPSSVKTTAGKLSPGFCKQAYARLRHLTTEMSRELSRAILAFARVHGANTIVFEQLRHFRPRGGKKRSTLRQRFHHWRHRQLVRQVEASAQEKGVKAVFVSPRNTSAYAFDGSGKLTRDKHNASLATFSTGKQYNADLNAAYNIGASYFWARLPEATRSRVEAVWREAQEQPTKQQQERPRPSRNGRASEPGKSSRTLQRIPVTLSCLWAAAA